MFKVFAVLAALVLVSPAAVARQAPMTSRVISIEVSRVVPDGDFNRMSGVVHGVIDPREAIVGLAALPKNPAGQYEYTSNFEIIQTGPRSATHEHEVIYIDSENRGSAISQGALGAFLKSRGAGYARVQWQTAISAGVPETAQGVGLVIMRDFGRLLLDGCSIRPGLSLNCRQGTPTVELKSNGPTPLVGTYDHLILGGISQSAWFVNSFIAEGFNVDPVTGRGVFDAAIAVDGAGGWLAINNMGAAAGVPMSPYVAPNGRPMNRRELLSRPRTDPLYVDIANYTDFYRLRAGLTSVKDSTAKFRRYDFPSAHVSGRGLTNARCNGGVRIQQNPIGYQPYMRAIVLGMMKQIGVKSAKDAHRLPRSTVFDMAPGQPAASAGFNPLPGVFTPVPKVDENLMPVGGVRFPDAVYPLGRPIPPSLPPVITTSINETCGNSGGFQPFGRDALDAHYASREHYLGRYSEQIDWLVSKGFLLAEDHDAMIENASELYTLWP